MARGCHTYKKKCGIVAFLFKFGKFWLNNVKICLILVNFCLVFVATDS